MALMGKIALVTGAGQGLGKGFSYVLLKYGAKVALLDRNETTGKSAKADFDEEYGEDRTIFLTCDVASNEQLKAMALIGKIALVTGAGQGLGKGFSYVLLKYGAKVFICWCNYPHDYKIMQVGSEFTIKCKVATQYSWHRNMHCNEYNDNNPLRLQTDAFQKTIERFGRIDIVSNNAGIVDETNWEKTVAINLNGVIRGTYLALKHMKKDNGGQGGVIVNTASLAGLSPILFCPVYTSTKHGVVGFTRAVAEASKASGYGVRVNALCPTVVRTPILDFLTNEKTAGRFGHLRHLSEPMIEQIGTTEVPEVAERFLQLVMDEDNNGAVIMVTKDGAVNINFPESVLDAPKTPLP